MRAKYLVSKLTCGHYEWTIEETDALSLIEEPFLCFTCLSFNFSTLLFALFWLLTDPSWALHIWDFNLNPSFLDTVPQALDPFVRPSFSISCLMFEHSFSSSDTLILMLSIPTFKTWFSFTADAQPPSVDPTKPLLNCLDPSRLSETRKQPAIEVRSWSCSKNRTWTIILMGSLSFCAAWVHASNESFWQSISLHSCSLSDSTNHGWDCSFVKAKVNQSKLVRRVTSHANLCYMTCIEENRLWKLSRNVTQISGL